jgi:hypothetical protein
MKIKPQMDEAVRCGASAAGGEPLRWTGSPACSRSVSAGVSKWRFPSAGDWRWGSPRCKP